MINKSPDAMAVVVEPCEVKAAVSPEPKAEESAEEKFKVRVSPAWMPV